MFSEKKEPMYYLRQDTDAPDLPQKIYIEPTSMCNLSCSICFRNGWIDEQKGHMEMGQFEKLAAEIKTLGHVEEVFFGGMGEPLFHPQICQMIALLPHDRKISLLTNGTMLSGAMSEALIRGGLSELWVSMDGFDRESYALIRQGSRYDTLIQNLENFNRARAGTNVRLCLTFVVTPENLGQLAKINAFADRFAVDELNISHMIPCSPVKKEDTLYLCEDIPVGKMRRVVSRGDGNHGDRIQGDRFPGSLKPGNLSPWILSPRFPTDAHECPFVSRNAVFVRWDGNVAPCMQLLHSCYTWLYEERRRITSFFYGNIGSRSLMACWNDPAYAEFRERVRVFYFPFCTICWGCEDRKENLTDCAYGEAPTCGACLWASGRVFCP